MLGVFKRRNSVYCLRGICLMPSPEKTEKIKNPWRPCQIHCTSERKVIQENDTDQKWEYDHWKARDATKGLRYDSIVHRWLTDPQFQESQWSHGWTEETVDTWTTSPPSVSSISKQGQKIKVSQHARVEVQRWEESRKDVNSRRIYTCNPITCCYQTPGRMGKPLHSEVEKRKANTAR